MQLCNVRQNLILFGGQYYKTKFCTYCLCSVVVPVNSQLTCRFVFHPCVKLIHLSFILEERKTSSFMIIFISRAAQNILI